MLDTSIPISLQMANFMTSNWGVTLWCSLIAILFSINFYKFKKLVNERISQFYTAINRISSEPPLNGFAETYPEFNQWATKHPVIGHIWSEFTETLVLPDPTDNHQKICNTQESCYSFDESIIFHEKINLSFYKALPNYLTGLGILGTFIGLFCGIYLASHGLASEDPNELKEALRQLLDGASLAFITSIFGIITSITFSAYEKRKINRANLALSIWNTELDKRILRITPEAIASKQLKELSTQTIHLETFVTEVAFNIAEALDQRMNGTLVPVLERLADSVDAMSANHNERNEDLLREIVDTFKSTMTDAAGQEIQALTGTLNELQNTLVPVIKEMNTAQQEMQQATTKITTQLGEFYQKTNQEFANGIAGVAKTIGESAQSARNLLNEDLTSAFKATTAQMKEAARSIAEHINKSSEQSGKALTDSVGKATEEMNIKMSQAGQLLTGELSETFTQAATRMNDAVNAIEQTVEKVRQSGEASGTAAVKTSTMLSQLTELIGKLAEHQQKVVDASASIKHAATAIDNSGNKFSQAATSTSHASTSLQNATDKMLGIQHSIEGKWNDYSKRFENVDKSLDAVFMRLSENHAAFCKTTIDFSSQLDKSVSEITGKLAASIDEFEGAISELSDALSKTRR
jgi:Mg2+ and Co2+ transporter CorA